MAEVKLDISTQTQQYEASLRRLEQLHEKYEKKLKALGPAGKEAAKAHDQLGKEAKKAYEEIRGPQERYQRRLEALNRLVKEGKITQQEYGDAARRAAEKLDRAGRSSQNAFGARALGMLRSFAGALGLTGGVAGAVLLVRKEFEHLIEAQQKMKEVSMPAADAQIAALRNLGAISAEERDRFIGRVREISQVARISQRDVYMRMSSAVSARGALPKEAAYAAVRESALLAPESQEAGQAIAGAALDIAKITGTTDARANIGLLMAIGQTARIEDVELLARNVAPALTGLTARGGSAREAGAIFAAITGGTADVTGRISKTAAANLGEKLYEFLSKPGAKGKAARAPQLKTALERIRYLQSHPELTEGFMGMVGGRAQTRPIIEQIITGQGPTAEALTDYLGRIPTAQEARGLYEKRLGVLQGTELQKTATFVRQLESTVEGLGIAAPEASRIAAAREQLGNILQISGLGWAETKLKSLQFEMSEDQLESFRNQIMERRNWLRHPRRRTWGGGGSGWWDEPTATESRQADVLDALLRFLEQNQETNERLAGASEKLGNRIAPPVQTTN